MDREVVHLPVLQEVPARRRAQLRAVRPTTLRIDRIKPSDLELGRVLFPADAEMPPRPRTRGECADGPRPCPWVGCRHHLYLDVNRSGSLRLNFPDLEVEDMGESCALDVAERGGVTLEEIGDLTNVTRERVRQLEEGALRSIRDGDVIDLQRAHQEGGFEHAPGEDASLDGGAATEPEHPDPDDDEAMLDAELAEERRAAVDGACRIGGKRVPGDYVLVDGEWRAPILGALSRRSTWRSYETRTTRMGRLSDGEVLAVWREMAASLGRRPKPSSVAARLHLRAKAGTVMVIRALMRSAVAGEDVPHLDIDREKAARATAWRGTMPGVSRTRTDQIQSAYVGIATRSGSMPSSEEVARAAGLAGGTASMRAIVNLALRRLHGAGVELPHYQPGAKGPRPRSEGGATMLSAERVNKIHEAWEALAAEHQRKPNLLEVASRAGEHPNNKGSAMACVSKVLKELRKRGVRLAFDEERRQVRKDRVADASTMAKVAHASNGAVPGPSDPSQAVPIILPSAPPSTGGLVVGVDSFEVVLRRKRLELTKQIEAIDLLLAGAP